MASLGTYLSTHNLGDVRVVAVEVDDPAGAAGAEAVAKADGLHIPLWLDPANNFSAAFSAVGVPTAALVSSDGTLAGTFPGAIDLSSTSIQAELRGVR